MSATTTGAAATAGGSGATSVTSQQLVKLFSKKYIFTRYYRRIVIVFIILYFLVCPIFVSTDLMTGDGMLKWVRPNSNNKRCTAVAADNTPGGLIQAAGLHQSSWALNLNLPLWQYPLRLQILTARIHFVEVQRELLRWKFNRIQGGTDDNPTFLTDEKSPRVLTSSLPALRHGMEQESIHLRYTLYYQRLFTRAMRHSDAMQLETLHALRHLATAIPILAQLWKGGDFCSWEGVECTVVDVPLHLLVDEHNPIVRRYLDEILPVTPSERERQRRFHLDARCSSYGEHYRRRERVQRFFSLNATTYSIVWARPDRPNLPILETPPGMPEECATQLNHPRIRKAAASLYIGSSAPCEWGQESCKSPVGQLVNRFLSIRNGGSNSTNRWMAKKLLIFQSEGRSWVVPVTMVKLKLRKLGLEGFIPTMRPFPTEQKTEGDARAPANDNIISPHSEGYWPRGNLNMTEWWAQSIDRSPCRLRHQMPPSPLEVGEGFAPILAVYLKRIVAHLETVGTRPTAPHGDLDAYFSEVAHLGCMLGTVPDGHPAIPPSVLQTLESEEVSALADELRLNARRTPARVNVDDSALFGMIDPRLVAIHSIDLSLNPGLSGTIPQEWLAAPFMRVADVSGTHLYPGMRTPIYKRRSEFPFASLDDVHRPDNAIDGNGRWLPVRLTAQDVGDGPQMQPAGSVLIPLFDELFSLRGLHRIDMLIARYIPAPLERVMLGARQAVMMFERWMNR